MYRLPLLRSMRTTRRFRTPKVPMKMQSKINLSREIAGEITLHLAAAI